MKLVIKKIDSIPIDLEGLSVKEILPGPFNLTDENFLITIPG